MTVTQSKRSVWEQMKSIFLLALTLSFGLTMSKEVGEYVKEGLELAVRYVIPTSFPFMIVSDIYVSYGRPENIRILKGAFCSLFGFSPYCLAPFICGNVVGFPIGAKMCADCYRSGVITKEEAERLIPLSSNPSCAFVIGGVGMGIWGEMKVGLLLLISIYSATMLCGIITRTKIKNGTLNAVNVNNSYDFIASVKNSGLSSISIISFISAFSVLNGLVSKRIKSTLVLYAFSALSEVTNAMKFYAAPGTLPKGFALVLSAFSLGFGGVCVGLQSSAFTSQEGLKMRKYYLIKLLEGVLSAGVFSILYMI